MTVLFIFFGAAIVIVPFYLLYSSSPRNNLVAQYTDETNIENLQKYLEKNGVNTFAKNLYSQGIVARRGGDGANPSLHVVNVEDLPKARELTKNFERSSPP